MKLKMQGLEPKRPPKKYHGWVENLALVDDFQHLYCRYVVLRIHHY